MDNFSLFMVYDYDLLCYSMHPFLALPSLRSFVIR
jgi:hypothetical protein